MLRIITAILVMSLSSGVYAKGENDDDEEVRLEDDRSPKAEPPPPKPVAPPEAAKPPPPPEPPPPADPPPEMRDQIVGPDRREPTTSPTRPPVAESAETPPPYTRAEQRQDLRRALEDINQSGVPANDDPAGGAVVVSPESAHGQAIVVRPLVESPEVANPELRGAAADGPRRRASGPSSVTASSPDARKRMTEGGSSGAEPVADVAASARAKEPTGIPGSILQIGDAVSTLLGGSPLSDSQANEGAAKVGSATGAETAPAVEGLALDTLLGNEVPDGSAGALGSLLGFALKKAAGGGATGGLSYWWAVASATAGILGDLDLEVRRDETRAPIVALVWKNPDRSANEEAEAVAQIRRNPTTGARINPILFSLSLGKAALAFLALLILIFVGAAFLGAWARWLLLALLRRREEARHRPHFHVHIVTPVERRVRDVNRDRLNP